MHKGLTLQELATKITGLKELKQDYIADTRKLRLVPDEPGIMKLQADLPQIGMSTFPILKRGHDQIGGRVNIPAKYYDRMLTSAPELLAQNVNHWFQAVPEQRMLRTLGGDLRAFLSNRYQRIENEEVANVALPVLYEMGRKHGMEIISCEVTETRMYIQATTTRLTKEVKKGDAVQAGVIIRNSEVGAGAVSVAPLVYRLVCLNGMVMNDERYRKFHVGGQQTNEDIWADDTKAAQDRTTLLELRDAIKMAVDEAAFDKRIDRLRDLTERKITGDVPGAIEVLGKKVGASEAEKSSFLRALIEGKDLSAWGVVNAVTSVANSAESYDRSVELEAAGGALVDLSAKEWREVLEVAA